MTDAIPAITSGNPIIDGIVEVVIELIAEGVHLLGPDAQKQKVADAVAAEVAKWPSIVVGSESARVDEIVARHHIAREARSDEPTVELPLPNKP